MKDEGKSHDKKRLFYSTLMNDNLLDCIVSKVEVVQRVPNVCFKFACLYFTFDIYFNIICLYSFFSCTNLVLIFILA